MKIKLTIKLLRNKELQSKNIQRELQMKQKILDLIEKYRIKGIYLQKKNRELFIS